MFPVKKTELKNSLVQQQRKYIIVYKYTSIVFYVNLQERK